MDIEASVVAWLLLQPESRSIGFEPLATMGSGPLAEARLNNWLRRLGFEPSCPNGDTEVLVVGREDWDEMAIHALLKERSGKNLRVYSQDMCLAYLISCKDPLQEDEATIMALAGDHPALNFMKSVGFNWPTTLIDPVGSGQFVDGFLKVGFLKFKGYSASKDGPKAPKRRQILLEAYDDDLPEAFPPAYIESWGPPSSSLRLKKIAESIAAFCTLNKRKSAPYKAAIENWESDLYWLKETLYDGRHQFAWPSTEVW